MFSHSIIDRSTLLQHAQFLVLGGGISGEAAGHLLSRLGKFVRLADKSAKNSDTSPFSEILPDTDVANALAQTEVIIKSPGISPEHPILQEARKQNRIILSEIYLGRLFFMGKLIGITGTDGKSTTTALTHHLIKAKYPNSEVGGNLGLPFSQFCDRNLDLAVLELSSYQLEDSPNLDLTSSAIITFAPDHLERHKTMTRYGLAKWKIVSHTNKNHTFITQKKVLDCLPESREPFIGKQILFGENGDIRIDAAKNRIHTQNGSYETKDFQLPGFHNLQNLSVAIGLAESVGLTVTEIQSGINSFSGLPHRFQSIPSSSWDSKKYPNLKFINDSKSTNFHSMLSGISGYTKNDNLYLILGGDPKDESLEPFLNRMSELTAQVYIYGKAADVWRMKIQDFGSIKAHYVTTIEEALIQIKINLDSQKEKIIILSPAAASFDQYKNFSERGEHFVALIKQYFGE